MPAAPAAPQPNISVYGDSQPIARAGTQQSLVDYLRTYTGRTCYQGGIGGQTTEQVRARLMGTDPDAVNRLNDTIIIWAGHNDFQNSLLGNYSIDETAIHSGITAMTGAVTHGRFLVLTMIFGNTTALGWSDTNYHNLRLNCNQWIRDTYTTKVVDACAILNNADPYDGVAKFEDRACTSVMFDESHPNSLGQALLARATAKALLSLGY